MRITSAAAAAAVLFGVITWTLFPERATLAATVKAIDEAQTVTWTTFFYTRVYSEDGKRSWLTTTRRDYAYQQPGLYRETYFGDDATWRTVTIIDARNGKALSIDGKRKMARFHAPKSMYDPAGPFGWVADFLKTGSHEFVGQRKVEGKTANVFRHHPGGRSADVWIDPHTNNLVGFSQPGADVFNPDAETNVAEKNWSKTVPVGSVTRSIVFNATLDKELFSLTPPPDFEVTRDPRPSVTEADLVEWLRVTASFNNGVFLNAAPMTEDRRLFSTMRKPFAEHNEVEDQLCEVFLRHWSSGNMPLVLRFQEDNTVEDSFRYTGKGARLGSSDRIVCWYQLKSTGQHRAVFGDLTARDVHQQDLPRPAAIE